MQLDFDSLGQISTSHEVKPHKYPKYPKSTTDPTYYEPQATRIANMKKASGVKLEGIYDFYNQDDLSKFTEENFKKNMSEASVDPMYSNKLLREEISQVANDLGFEAEKAVNEKNKSIKDKSERIQENIKTAEIISNNNKTDE